jgi:hypothetical protein
LAQALNTLMDWRLQSKDIDRPGYKVFVIERVASLILACDTRFKSIALLMSDAPKMAYARYGDPGYRGAFDLIRKAIKVEIGDGRG